MFPCRYPDKEGDPTVWTSLLSALFESLKPQLKPLLDVLIKKAIDQFLNNAGGASGVLSQMSEESYNQAVAKTVDDLLNS